VLHFNSLLQLVYKLLYNLCIYFYSQFATAMLDFLRKIFYPHVTPMNMIYVDRSAILDNYTLLKKLQPQAELFPVLKSNAYGHGIKHIAKILNKTDAPYLVVDSYPEYMLVKKYSKKNILLLGETLPENYRHFDYKKVTFCVYNIKSLEALGRSGKPVKIHLFVNTGMYREGANLHSLPEYIALLQKYPHIILEWVLSHFHSADIQGMSAIDDQVTEFKKNYYTLLDAGFTPRYRYIANSAGILKMQDDFFNAARPGIALYGYNPLLPTDEFYDNGRKLKPALSIRSRVVAFQEVAKGQWVSYEYKRLAPQATTVGVVPFGYTEWLTRAASNYLSFARKGKKIQQIGRVTMNLSCIDCENYSVQLWDEVEIISASPSAHNSVYALAQKSGTNPYEVLVKFDSKIRRVVV